MEIGFELIAIDFIIELAIIEDFISGGLGGSNPSIGPHFSHLKEWLVLARYLRISGVEVKDPTPCTF